MSKTNVIMVALLAAGAAGISNAEETKEVKPSFTKKAWDATVSGFKTAVDYSVDLFRGNKGSVYGKVEANGDYQSSKEKSSAQGGESGYEILREAHGGSRVLTSLDAEAGIKEINDHVGILAKLENDGIIPRLGNLNGTLEQTLISLGAQLHFDGNRFWFGVPVYGKDKSNIDVNYAGIPVEVRTSTNGSGVVFGYETPKGEFRIIGKVLGFSGNNETKTPFNESKDAYKKSDLGLEVRHLIANLPYGRITGREYLELITEKSGGYKKETPIIGGSFGYETNNLIPKGGDLRVKAELGAEYSNTMQEAGASARDVNYGARMGVEFVSPPYRLPQWTRTPEGSKK